MKFPRNARIFRGQLDFAPFASVLFLLVVFVLLGKRLYTPGIQVKLPAAGNLVLTGPEGPTFSVVVTTNAIYFRDQAVSKITLSNQLCAARLDTEPPTLILQVDKDVTEEKWMEIVVLAQRAGITNILHATFPRLSDSAVDSKP
jgi:biopolymer transport protein ExbD